MWSARSQSIAFAAKDHGKAENNFHGLKINPHQTYGQAVRQIPLTTSGRALFGSLINLLNVGDQSKCRHHQNEPIDGKANVSAS